jgi:hypothetical protein
MTDKSDSFFLKFVLFLLVFFLAYSDTILAKTNQIQLKAFQLLLFVFDYLFALHLYSANPYNFTLPVSDFDEFLKQLANSFSSLLFIATSAQVDEDFIFILFPFKLLDIIGKLVPIEINYTSKIQSDLFVVLLILSQAD